MSKRLWLLLAAAALIGGSASAQNTGMAALQAAAQKMGVTNMKSIQYSGAGWQGMVGQNFSPDRDWPRVDLKDYTRTIDFDTMSSKEEYTRSQGNNSQQGGGAGFPFLQDQKVVNFVSGNYAWTLNAQGQPVAQPDQAELRRFIDSEARAGGGLLVIEQAEIVLAALAQHDLAPLLGGIGIELVELLIEHPHSDADEGVRQRIHRGGL
jgi:hypothetical protein